MRRFFLGLAANYNREDRHSQLFTIGRKEDYKDLQQFLLRKYTGERALLTKNGRSALALALKAYFDKGDKILVNGFTCYAVYEAIKAAGLEPVFADITKTDLNFNANTLNDAWAGSDNSRPWAGDEAGGTPAARSEASTVGVTATAGPAQSSIKGIIIQNTLGHPTNIVAIEKFATEHNLIIIEDLAHCAGVKYPDGREVGTVGAATALSFGKDKSIDTVSGGAVIFRHPYKNRIEAPFRTPKLSDHLRARFYPTFGAICRVLAHIHLGGALMRFLVRIHWVEKSADSKLDLKRKPSKFETRRALIQIKSLSKSGEKPIREFYLVKNRAEVLAKLKKSGYYFDAFWYEKPVSPVRYYKKVHFPEESCKNAVYVADHIINLPTYYKKNSLKAAREIIKEYLEEEQ